jgi:hypothetical protein
VDFRAFIELLVMGFELVGVLGLIVVVRTFLSWSLEVEVNGRWPWQAATGTTATATAQDGEL